MSLLLLQPARQGARVLVVDAAREPRDRAGGRPRRRSAPSARTPPPCAADRRAAPTACSRPSARSRLADGRRAHAQAARLPVRRLRLGHRVPIDAHRLHYSQIALHGSPHTPKYFKAPSTCSPRRVRTGLLIDGRIPLADVPATSTSATRSPTASRRHPLMPRFMRRALALAKRGRDFPEPAGGCVLVKEQIVAEGWHAVYGGPTPRRRAQEGRPQSPGSTAYVTLEPCCAHPARKRRPAPTPCEGGSRGVSRAPGPSPASRQGWRLEARGVATSWRASPGTTVTDSAQP